MTALGKPIELERALAETCSCGCYKTSRHCCFNGKIRAADWSHIVPLALKYSPRIKTGSVSKLIQTSWKSDGQPPDAGKRHI